VGISRLSWHRMRRWLKQERSRTSIVGVLTLVAALTLGLLNYRLQIGRPEVEPGTAFLWQTPQGNLVGGVDWLNRGKQPARRGFVTFMQLTKTAGGGTN
jgi:hypothetical protein